MGIRAAKGEYLFFVDSDDYWDDKEALQKIDKEIIQSSADIIRFSLKRLYSDKNERVLIPDCDFSMLNNLSAERKIIQMIELGKLKISACTMSIKRQFLESNDLFFKKGIKAEDIEWGIRLIACVPTFSFVKDCFYVYRVGREGSVTSTIDYHHLCTYCDIIEDAVSIAEKCSPELKGAIISYLAYHVLIASALNRKISISKRQRTFIQRRLAAFCKKYLKKCSYDKRVRAAKRVYAIFGYKIMARLLGFYLMHRGR